MSKELSEDEKLKQTVNQYVFDIRRQVVKKAYWNAAQLAHDLYELLDKQPYIEANNPPLSREETINE